MQYLYGYPNETLIIEIASAEILLDKEKQGLLSDENLQLQVLTLEGYSRRADIDQKIKDRALKLANTLNEIINS